MFYFTSTDLTNGVSIVHLALNLINPKCCQTAAFKEAGAGRILVGLSIAAILVQLKLCI